MKNIVDSNVYLSNKFKNWENLWTIMSKEEEYVVVNRCRRKREGDEKFLLKTIMKQNISIEKDVRFDYDDNADL